jgi:hypothetical protein
MASSSFRWSARQNRNIFYVQAGELLERALANQPHESGAPLCPRQLGDLATAAGDFEQAERHFAAAAAQMEHFGTGWQLDQAFLLTPITKRNPRRSNPPLPAPWRQWVCNCCKKVTKVFAVY